MIPGSPSSSTFSGTAVLVVLMLLVSILVSIFWANFWATGWPPPYSFFSKNSLALILIIFIGLSSQVRPIDSILTMSGYSLYIYWAILSTSLSSRCGSPSLRMNKRSNSFCSIPFGYPNITIWRSSSSYFASSLLSPSSEILIPYDSKREAAK